VSSRRVVNASPIIFLDRVGLLDQLNEAGVTVLVPASSWRNSVVQTGTQRRSDGHFRAAAKYILPGELGQISRVSTAVGFNEPQ
jgi:hypothetical protein